MSNLPLVSIICVSHNHERFIKEALASIMAQSYRHFEIIIVDDCSTDNSPQIIQEFVLKNPQVKHFLLNKPHGLNKAFNMGLKASVGQYIIDFSTDDVMLPDRLQLQVEAFEKLPIDYGMVFTDAIYIDEKSKAMHNHYRRKKSGKLNQAVPSGDVYSDVLERFFICTPTMMYSRELLTHLNGYDEALSFEDFDVWVRGGRKFKFHYLDEILTARRIVKGSMSENFMKGRDTPYHQSTLEVCKKAISLNASDEENKALTKRMKYEMRQAYFSRNYNTSIGYAHLLKQMGSYSTMDKAICELAQNKINVSGLYKQWTKFRVRN